jgi:hypothetical protein
MTSGGGKSTIAMALLGDARGELQFCVIDP